MQSFQVETGSAVNNSRGTTQISTLRIHPQQLALQNSENCNMELHNFTKNFQLSIFGRITCLERLLDLTLPDGQKTFYLFNEVWTIFTVSFKEV